MATDIYGVEIGTPRAWKLDNALLTFGSNNNNLLATGLDLTYSRTVQSYFPINNKDRVLVTGSPTGSLKITAIVGPYGDLKTFVDQYSDVCKLSKNVITITPGGIKPCEGSGGAVKFTLKGCLTSQFGINVTENSNGTGMINSTINMSFLGLTLE